MMLSLPLVSVMLIIGLQGFRKIPSEQTAPIWDGGGIRLQQITKETKIKRKK